MYNDFKLLVDGENAFNEILSCIDNAKHVIKVNMFIWRDDEIGNEIGKHLYDAANRGVKIFISIDRFGDVLENIEHRYRVDIKEHTSVSMDKRLSMTIVNEQLEAVMEVISTLLPISYEIHGNSLIIKDNE